MKYQPSWAIRASLALVYTCTIYVSIQLVVHYIEFARVEDELLNGLLLTFHGTIIIASVISIISINT